MEKENAIEITKFVVTTTVPGFVTAAEIISQLRAEYDGVTYEVSTPLGMAKAVAARKKLRDARIALDKKKPEVKREALDFCNKVEADYKMLRAAVSEYEDIPDKAINDELERKAAEKKVQDDIKAAAQKLLDDKIIEIGKLSLRCIGQTSDEITLFIARLDATPIGGEFTGDTRKRAEDAKEEAITAIREMLTATVQAEETAATRKAEQEAEAVRLEAERVEREAAEKLQREAMAVQQAELDEQKRLNDIEAARLADMAAIETERMRIDREFFEAEQAEANKKQAEINRIASEKADAELAEVQRLQKLDDDKKREEDRQAAIVAEAARKKAETERKAAEKKAKLLAARCDNAEVALVKILDICRDKSVSPAEKVDSIELIAEASK